MPYILKTINFKFVLDLKELTCVIYLTKMSIFDLSPKEQALFVAKF